MSKNTLAQQITTLKNQIASGVARVKNGETDITFRDVTEMQAILADLEAQMAARTCPKRRFKRIQMYPRSGY